MSSFAHLCSASYDEAILNGRALIAHVGSGVEVVFDAGSSKYKDLATFPRLRGGLEATDFLQFLPRSPNVQSTGWKYPTLQWPPRLVPRFGTSLPSSSFVTTHQLSTFDTYTSEMGFIICPAITPRLIGPDATPCHRLNA